MSQTLKSWAFICIYLLTLFAYFWDGVNQLDKPIAVLWIPAFIGYMAGKVATQFYVQRSEIPWGKMSRLSLPTPNVVESSRLIDFVCLMLWVVSWYVIYDSPFDWWAIQLGTLLASVLTAATISYILNKAQKDQS